MKLKYYLRGLGIGIIVTAVIMGVVSGSHKETLSDREIKERAAELGMVEQGGSLADSAEQEAAEPEAPTETPIEAPTETPTESPAESPTETPTEAPTEKPTETPMEEPTEKPTETPIEAPTEKPTETPAKSPEQTPEAVEKATPKVTSDMVSVKVKSGDSSFVICQMLEEKGLIASASDFDTYLCTKGYDRKLRVGSYEIPADTQPEKIAKILCGME